MKITTDLTKYQAKSILSWEFDMEEMRLIEPKDEIAKAALNKFINRTNGQPIDVHRTNGRRIFNPFTAMKRSHRKFVSYHGKSLIEIDAANSHPLIMVYKMISEGLNVEADLKTAVEAGTFYDYLIDGGRSRSETKELWFSFCYSTELKTSHPVYKKLNQLFPKFIESFTTYAKGRNLSEYLQGLEASIWVDKISTALMRADIPHTTIHDSVVFAGVQFVNKVLDIIYAAFGSITPPLHVEWLNGEHLDFVRVPNPDNSKYLEADWALLEELHACKADPFADYDKPVTAIHMIDGDNEFPLFTMGNFSAVSGKSKSGKTLLISAMVASALSGDTVLGKFRGEMPQDRQSIVYIDTEMADFDLQWVMKRIMKMADITKGDKVDITFYRLREKDTHKRVELIDLAIRSTDNVGLVVVDGIRDIVKDINNPEESTLAINHIMRWTDVYRLHLIAVLHQNPGKESGNKLRGHIGTEAMNKAEAVISVVKDGDDSVGMVKSDFMRRESFKSFGLGYDKDTNLPMVIEDQVSSKVTTPDDITGSDYIYVLNKMFENKESYPKSNFIEVLKQMLLLRGYAVTKRMMPTVYEYLINEDVISVEIGANNKHKVSLSMQ